MIVDLADVTFCGTAGISVIIGARNFAAIQAACPVAICRLDAVPLSHTDIGTEGALPDACR